MPHPHAGEEKSHYVGRFMGSTEARSDFPDPKQRAAVAYSMFGEKKKPQKKAEALAEAYAHGFAEFGKTATLSSLAKELQFKLENLLDEHRLGSLSPETTGHIAGGLLGGTLGAGAGGLLHYALRRKPESLARYLGISGVLGALAGGGAGHVLGRQAEIPQFLRGVELMLDPEVRADVLDAARNSR